MINQHPRSSIHTQLVIPGKINRLTITFFSESTALHRQNTMIDGEEDPRARARNADDRMEEGERVPLILFYEAFLPSPCSTIIFTGEPPTDGIFPRPGTWWMP